MPCLFALQRNVCWGIEGDGTGRGPDPWCVLQCHVPNPAFHIHFWTRAQPEQCAGDPGCCLPTSGESCFVEQEDSYLRGASPDTCDDCCHEVGQEGENTKYWGKIRNREGTQQRYTALKTDQRTKDRETRSWCRGMGYFQMALFIHTCLGLGQKWNFRGKRTGENLTWVCISLIVCRVPSP